MILSGAHFVVPAAITIAAVGFTVFEAFLAASDDLALAQTALTLTATCCGLLVILFLEPPTPYWVCANPLSGDWRPTALAAALFAVLVVFTAVPLTRDFYELKVPDVWKLAIIGLVIVAWTVSLRAIWRLDLPIRVRGRLHGRASPDELEGSWSNLWLC